MKNTIIRINDISQINLSQVSVYDLNNRYIDPMGNMYGLKYNRTKKKIMIIKLVRTHASDSSFFHKRMIKKKISKNKTTPLNDNIGIEDQQSVIENDITGNIKGDFDPYAFINDSLSMIQVHKSRLTGIIRNLRNSNVFSKQNKTENIELGNLFRKIEMDVIQLFDKVNSDYKELVRNPRSITHYHASMDNKGREVIDALSGDNKKIMQFITLYEMHYAIKDIYRNLRSAMKELYEFIGNKNIEEIKTIHQEQKQFFLDAEVSVINTIDEIDVLLDDIKHLEEFVSNPENF